MQIICKDGTTIQCRDFEATDSGVLFFQEAPSRGESEDEAGDEAETERASGFVPHVELRFVLPDEMVQRGGTQQSGVPQGVPSGAPPQAGGMAQQQQMHGYPGSSPPSSGQQAPEPGRR